MIRERLNILKTREKPVIHVKYKENKEVASHLSKSKKAEKDYKYLICDYCKGEINISKKKDERDGGIAELPMSLTNITSIITVALHNRCLNKVLNELEPRR